MSTLGQKQTLRLVRGMSALPPKADITDCDWNVAWCQKQTSVILFRPHQHRPVDKEENTEGQEPGEACDQQRLVINRRC